MQIFCTHKITDRTADTVRFLNILDLKILFTVAEKFTNT